MKIALVHDDFIQSGGAESLFATISSIFPSAPVYTSIVDWNKLPKSIDRQRIKTSFIQKIPFSKKFYKAFLPLYPLAFESFDFNGFDLVISSTTRFAKAIITTPDIVHVCYINSLPRFLWNDNAKKEYIPIILRLLLRPFFSWLRRWDKASSSRADYFIANSKNISSQAKEIYKRDCGVIHPFANLNFFVPAKFHNWELKSQNYFLVVSRLVKWKKIDIAIEACLHHRKPLYIVGEGPDKKRLKNLAAKLKARVTFLGKVNPKKLRELYQNCLALIITQEEDFGISAVEAQACGIPVIAYNGGGVVEIISSENAPIRGMRDESIKDRKTGILFSPQSAKALKDAMSAYSDVKWSKSACRKNSLRFSQANFESNFKKVVSSKLNFDL